MFARDGPHDWALPDITTTAGAPQDGNLRSPTEGSINFPQGIWRVSIIHNDREVGSARINGVGLNALHSSANECKFFDGPTEVSAIHAEVVGAGDGGKYVHEIEGTRQACPEPFAPPGEIGTRFALAVRCGV